VTSSNVSTETDNSRDSSRNTASNRGDTILRADAVSVRFGRLTAVDEVSLELGRSKILGLIGPNGAGKTTLFNALTGYVPLSGGRVV